ncbi:hypothetical protein TYRP_020448 [Tyrophagus putrescentiae]|nr:hypothetical protein TYRP_020448 [Tyrophagus putrescentiae]
MTSLFWRTAPKSWTMLSAKSVFFSDSTTLGFQLEIDGDDVRPEPELGDKLQRRLVQLKGTEVHSLQLLLENLQNGAKYAALVVGHAEEHLHQAGLVLHADGEKVEQGDLEVNVLRDGLQAKEELVANRFGMGAKAGQHRHGKLEGQLAEQLHRISGQEDVHLLVDEVGEDEQHVGVGGVGGAAEEQLLNHRLALRRGLLLLLLLAAHLRVQLEEEAEDEQRGAHHDHLVVLHQQHVIARADDLLLDSLLAVLDDVQEVLRRAALHQQNGADLLNLLQAGACCARWLLPPPARSPQHLVEDVHAEAADSVGVLLVAVVPQSVRGKDVPDDEEEGGDDGVLLQQLLPPHAVLHKLEKGEGQLVVAPDELVRREDVAQRGDVAVLAGEHLRQRRGEADHVGEELLLRQQEPNLLRGEVAVLHDVGAQLNDARHEEANGGLAHVDHQLEGLQQQQHNRPEVGDALVGAVGNQLRADEGHRADLIEHHLVVQQRGVHLPLADLVGQVAQSVEEKAPAVHGDVVPLDQPIALVVKHDPLRLLGKDNFAAFHDLLVLDQYEVLRIKRRKVGEGAVEWLSVAGKRAQNGHCLKDVLAAFALRQGVKKVEEKVRLVGKQVEGVAK